jgi:NAD(P)-dependent dehydrogenase (short-subunit alcohol dehydrogenase family)
MESTLKGQIAVVTGGGGGYGAGIAEVLRDRGAAVWITDIQTDGLNRTAERLGVKAVQADVTKAEDWDRVIGTVMDAHGRLDILVNNAGGGICIAPLEEQPDDLIALSVTVNLTGKILGCKRAAKIMKAQTSGTIINISSICAKEAWPGWSTYSAAKAGVVSLSECLYTELREHGVRVTTVIPSWGATKFTDAASLGPRDADTLAKCIKPTELGELIAYICSLPPHLEMLEATLLPTVQQIEPL